MLDGERKIFVLDTSAIMSLVQDVTTFRDSELPGFAGILGDNEVVIPRVVLDELDGLRKDKGDRSKIALEAARQLEQYSLLGNLLEGVETEKGGTLRIAARPTTERVVAWGLKANVADHEILATTMEIEDFVQRCGRESDSGDDNSDDNSVAENRYFALYASGEDVSARHINDTQAHGGSKPAEAEVVLITQDRILRVLARSVYGVRAEELKSIWVADTEYSRSFERVELSAEELDSVINVGTYNATKSAIANRFFHLVDKENPDIHYAYAMARGTGTDKAELLDRAKIDYLKVAGEVQGRNVRQRLLLWTLMGCGDPDPMAEDGIRLVTVSGPAGSGKSFLTLAAAWERLERGHFERIVITRPMVDVGASLGYLPGTLEEKIKPWGGPIEDNLRAIVQVPSFEEGKGGGGRRGVQRSTRPFDAKAWLEMDDRLELVPLTYIRGRTFRRTFVILEEAQNIERGPLKVLLTRLGEGSMIVILGDKSQIDNQFLSSRNNGLVHAINAFREWPQAVHIHLKQIVRSDLAEAANRLL